MTTRTVPPRTMLPPNLVRHYYETLRDIAAGDGLKSVPWYQLSGQQKAALENDLGIFRQAILRAEDEQDLVASVNASTTAAAADKPTAAVEAPAAGCGCPGCFAVAALTDLIKQAKLLEEALGGKVRVTGEGATVNGLIFTTPSAEQVDELAKAAREAIGRWRAKESAATFEGIAPAGRSSAAEQLREDLLLWQGFPPFTPKVFLNDVGGWSGA